VGGFGREIRIAGITEHVQVLIGGGNSMEGEVWLVMLIALVGRQFNRYVAVWSPSTQ
jgi:transketolase N-terminal domain/subunit